MGRYISKELKPRDFKHIGTFLADAPLYETLMMRGASRAMEDGGFDGWWYGCFEDGTDLRALMCIEGTTANLWGRDIDAIDQMANDLLKTQGGYTSAQSHRHTLLGETRSMDRFWATFHAIPRQLVSDRVRSLMGSGVAPGRTSPRITLDPATPADLALVSEFRAEYAVEAYGIDPRMGGREAHDQRCSRLIESGRQLIAREGPRPILLCELAPMGEQMAMLDGIFVPKPFRARKRMIAKVLAAAREQPLAQGKELLFFADSKELVEAGEQGGFELRCRYRIVAMRG